MKTISDELIEQKHAQHLFDEFIMSAVPDDVKTILTKLYNLNKKKDARIKELERLLTPNQ